MVTYPDFRMSSNLYVLSGHVLPTAGPTEKDDLNTRDGTLIHPSAATDPAWGQERSGFTRPSPRSSPSPPATSAEQTWPLRRCCISPLNELAQPFRRMTAMTGRRARPRRTVTRRRCTWSSYPNSSPQVHSPIRCWTSYNGGKGIGWNIEKEVVGLATPCKHRVVESASRFRAMRIDSAIDVPLMRFSPGLETKRGHTGRRCRRFIGCEQNNAHLALPKE